MKDRSSGDEVVIALDQDEAVVLFEWLARFNEQPRADFEDPAEEYVLWNLECVLESILVAPFLPEYAEVLAQARKRVREARVDESTPANEG